VHRNSRGGPQTRTQGSPYARFQRALRTGQASIAWDAALELEHVGLEDALALVLLVGDDPGFERAGARWLGRLCLEVFLGDGAPSAAHLASALSALPDRSAAIALSGACTELGLERAAATTRAAYVHVQRAGGGA
jgi:hypothetical protein